MTSKDEYVKAAETRIVQTAKQIGAEIPAFVRTAILVELKTLYDIGQRSVSERNDSDATTSSIE